MFQSDISALVHKINILQKRPLDFLRCLSNSENPNAPHNKFEQKHKPKLKYNQRNQPSALHREHVNDKNASKNDHILTEQIHEVAVIYFSGNAVARTT